MPVTYCDVFAFLWRSLQTMGCFFDCFSIRHRNDNHSRRHHQYHHPPTSSSSTSISKLQVHDEAEPKIRLSSLFTNEDEENCVVKERETLVQRLGQSEIDQELLEEAKFLKACGTLPETPAEIRKAVTFAENVEELDIQKPHRMLKSSPEIYDIQPPTVVPKNAEGSDSHREFVILESSPQTPEQLQNVDTSAIDFQKSDTKRSHSKAMSSPDTSVETPQSETLSENLESSASHAAHSVLEMSPETPEDIRKEMSPETPEDMWKEETLTENLEKSELTRPCSVVKYSPYPTPAKLTDDMQTPGTVFATNMKNLSRGNARIRSQYVYTVLNPIENLCEHQESKEEKFVLHGLLDHEGESVTPLSKVGSSEESAKRENIGDVSLSSWLKPPLSAKNGAANCKKPNIGRTPGDRPIIGLVATHWNEQEEASQNSPKWWDGNGIPNSTTKYKEDQKVRWHATPFEERLEKALSEETAVPHRKSITGAPIVFDETEGLDTATSQLKPVNSPPSLVSF